MACKLSVTQLNVECLLLLQDVLGKLLQPPSGESINDSIKRLHNIGALDTDEVTRQQIGRWWTGLSLQTVYMLYQSFYSLNMCISFIKLKENVKYYDFETSKLELTREKNVREFSKKKIIKEEDYE